MFCSVNTQMSQILFYAWFQQIRLSVIREGSRNELQLCLRKGKETHLSQFLQSRRKAVWKTDQNKPSFLAKGVDQNSTFHKKGSRGTARMLGLVRTFIAHATMSPSPAAGGSPPSSGSQGISLPQRWMKSSGKVSLFPDPASNVPWPSWICSLAYGSIPGFRQLGGSKDTAQSCPLPRVLPF